MNKYLLEQLQSRPIPQTETSVYIHLDDSDSDSDPDDSKNTFIIDKRDEFKDTSYDTFINNFKLSHVSKTLSTNIEKPKPKSKSEIKLINKHSTDVANSFIIIGKVDNLLITISSPSEFFSTSSSIPVKVVVDGVLIDTKKLPQYSKKKYI